MNIDLETDLKKMSDAELLGMVINLIELESMYQRMVEVCRELRGRGIYSIEASAKRRDELSRS